MCSLKQTVQSLGLAGMGSVRAKNVDAEGAFPAHSGTVVGHALGWDPEPWLLHLLPAQE